MSKTFVPVILAGGKGERFWPLSRRQRPKQFLCLDGGEKSLLQATAERLLSLAGGYPNLWVITSALVANGVREQLPALPEANLLVEPEGKDTAPAIAWTSLEIAHRYGEDTIIGFFPADHWIGNGQGFVNTVKAASEFASENQAIVTLGITPTYPSTGYGYVERGDIQGNVLQLPVYKVTRFTEKPDRQTAETFIQTGKYSWNSGMFVFQAGVVLTELGKYAANILNPLKDKGKDAYTALEKISIDYALMEKTQLASIIPTDFGWDDLGDWNALERLLKQDRDNVTIGNHLGKDTKDSIIYASDDNEIIVTIGLEDVVIVRDGNATLVVNKNRTQEIKKVLKLLQDYPNSEQFL